MVKVTDCYKLIRLVVDGQERILRINPSEAWNVMDVEIDGKTFSVNEGDEIKFLTESGTIKTGTAIKLGGKGEKAKFTIAPTGINCEETWSAMSIVDNQLSVISEPSDDEE